jgi:hypothetical protein
MVRRRIFAVGICPQIAMLLASALVFAQASPTPVASTPHIIVSLPKDVPSDSVWIGYSISGPRGSSGGPLTRKPNLRAYVIYTTIRDGPPQHAKVVVYAPGCQFQVYKLDFHNSSSVSLPFECILLPTKVVHGYLPPNQIPKPIYSAMEKKVAVVAELEDDWVCDFFMRSRRGNNIIIVGSCLIAGIPLGTVGEIDPDKEGYFDITIPDFTRDPVFQGTEQVPKVSHFGVIELGLHDKTVARQIGAIWPVGSSQEKGLTVQGEYPYPVEFTAH